MTDLECLQAIEFLVSVNEMPNAAEKEQIIHDVYATVHSHLKSHSCHYVHEAWRDKADEIFRAAKVAGFVA